MKTVINVIIRFQAAKLLFADCRAVQAFKDLVTTYVDECGITSGFGAYGVISDAFLYN